MAVAPEKIKETPVGKKIVSDFDGVWVDRGLAKIGTYFKEQLEERFGKKADSIQDLSVIPDMDHTPINRPARGLKGKISFLHHSRRKPTEFAGMLKEEGEKGAWIHIASGRPATTEYYGVTVDQADRAGIPYVDISHTPVTSKKDKANRINSILSKAHVIESVNTDEVWEDDRKSAKSFAVRFPAKVKYFDYGYPIEPEFLAQHPNLEVVSVKELRKRKKAEKSAPGVSETRNAWIREKTAGGIHNFMLSVHKYTRWLTPTHLNILGFMEVAAGAAIAASRDPNEPGGEKVKTAEAAVLIAKGSILDAGDGSLARIMEAEDPNSIDSKRGPYYDALSDRGQEKALAKSREKQANERGGLVGSLGKVAAFGTDITNPFTSLTRAFAEHRGKVVPESGRGIFGAVGTRPGRALIGGIATLWPEPKGIPLQLTADVLMTTSNLVTTVDRLRIAFSKEEGTLSKEARDNARTRLTVLGISTAVSLADSLFTYWRMHKDDPKPPEMKPVSSFTYVRVLNAIERYCSEEGLEHRFVGGTVTDWIGPQTEFNIDVSKKRVTLKKPNVPVPVRSDGSVKDIDLIVFNANEERMTRARETFARWKVVYENSGVIIPQISIEAAKQPDGEKRSRIKQFVIAWEMDKKGAPHLVFGKVDQEIKRASIAPWKLDTGNGTNLTILNPVGQALCYELRVPSGYKPKDLEEIGTYNDWVIRSPYSKIDLINNLANQTIEEGLRRGVDYNEIFREWRNYIHNVSHNVDTLTNIKRSIIGVYWKTIGTQVAHGKVLGLAKFSDRLTG
ncbi:MAG: hypothetical protein M1142_02580 [Patescibacteria group bacterium]|nr:hypothetical protein [Patescibacteria group bacterium]